MPWVTWFAIPFAFPTPWSSCVRERAWAFSRIVRSCPALSAFMVAESITVCACCCFIDRASAGAFSLVNAESNEERAWSVLVVRPATGPWTFVTRSSAARFFEARASSTWSTPPVIFAPEPSRVFLADSAAFSSFSFVFSSRPRAMLIPYKNFMNYTLESLFIVMLAG